MITVDASAIVAILLSEPEESAFRDLIREAGGGVISPVNHWEVLVRMGVLRGERGRQVADQLMVALKIEVKDATRSHSEIAATAQSRFGKATPAKATPAKAKVAPKKASTPAKAAKTAAKAASKPKKAATKG